MEPEDVFRAAQARADELPKLTAANGSVEALRADCAAFFAKIPEPPVYPRLGDPARERARELLGEGEALLARCVALGRSPKGDDGVRAAIERALKAHLASLCHTVEAKLGDAEREWHQALELEETVGLAKRVWLRTDEGPRPVYDREHRESRYDPGPEPMVAVKLVCPLRACRTEERYRFSPRYARHQFTCVKCKKPFLAFFGEVRQVDIKPTPGGRHYVFTLKELEGGLVQLELEDHSGGDLHAARRDLMAFLYGEDRELRSVLDLSSGKLLWVVKPSSCFVATVAFGPTAPELEAFRTFRDDVLYRSSAGTALVRLYYRCGPALAERLLRHPRLRAYTRAALVEVHRWLVGARTDE